MSGTLAEGEWAITQGACLHHSQPTHPAPNLRVAVWLQPPRSISPGCWPHSCSEPPFSSTVGTRGHGH